MNLSIRIYILVLCGVISSISPHTIFGVSPSLSPNILPDWALGGFVRPSGVNPVINPTSATSFQCPMRGENVKWEESDTFNPAAVVKDGKIYVLYRAEDNSATGIGKRTSRIGLAETTDGMTMKRFPTPVMYPANDNNKIYEWEGGCEDPRIAVTEDGTYVMTYTSWNRKIPRLCIATSRDLINWKKYGPAFAKAFNGRFADLKCKSGSIVTRIDKNGNQVIAKVNGKYLMYWGENMVAAATSDNLTDWEPVLGDDNNLLSLIAPRDYFFDSALTECGPPAIITDKGILLLYNGKNRTDGKRDPRFNSGTYSAGQVLFDLNHPYEVISRLDVPFFRPMADFEKSGQYADGTVFIEGLVYFKGKWYLYYGCADSMVGVAICDPKVPAPGDPVSNDLTGFVNMFMGTAGDNGQVTPCANAPFGMLSVGPDSKPRLHSGYDFNTDEISGISINRPSGVGCSGGGGNISILPGYPDAQLKIVKRFERANPGYYGVILSNNVNCEFTTTGNVALERYVFPVGMNPVLSIDFAASFLSGTESEVSVNSPTKISGWFSSQNVCSHGRYKLWFSLSSDSSFEVEQNDHNRVVLKYDNPKGNAVEIRIAVSSVSVEAADKLLAQCSGKTFNDVRLATKEEWNSELSKFQIEGGTHDDRMIFYTSLYRALLSPADVTSPDGTFRGTDDQIYDTNGRRAYGSWSLWDTFRTKFPLLAISHPQRMGDICQSLVHLYRTGKENWSTQSEPTINIRTEHATILLLDAYRKGIRDFDFRPGYEGMKREADLLQYDTPDHCLESVYDLWALSQIAGINNLKSDSVSYMSTADKIFKETWMKEFMNVTEDYKVMKNNGLYQGSRWQYRWAAPQYVDTMISLVGKEKLLDELKYFFDNNLYNQGNEPDIHVPYLFNRFGAPELTQDIVYRLLTDDNMVHIYGGQGEYPEPYVGRAFKNLPEGYSPEMDEDDGAMSAWYIFSAMGIYPMLVGSDVYELTSPIFDKVVINLDNGKRFTISVDDRKNPDDQIKSIMLNGKKIEGFQLRHNDITLGGELIFRY